MPPQIDWNNTEVELIVADYFSMLSEELIGNPINKTHHRNALRPLLNNRSNGSIEFKHQNISAVLIKLGLPFIKGYKPKWNFQQILEQKVVEFLKTKKSTLEPKFIQFSESLIENFKAINFNSILESPPERQVLASDPEFDYERKPIKINYLEKEQNSQKLGQCGERLVLEFERWRLINIGKESLADKIEWIAEHDDGAGFDILSKNQNGTDRFIEVKTTKLTKEAPIFFSKNEYEFSLIYKDNFHLYRLFNFNVAPKLFTINGSFDEFCTKEATHYKGSF